MQNFTFFFEIQNMNFTVYLLYSSKKNNLKKVPGWKSIAVAGSAGKDSLLGFVVVVVYFLKRRSVTLQPQLLLQQKQGNRLVRSLQLPRKVLKKKTQHKTKHNNPFFSSPRVTQELRVLCYLPGPR